MYAAKSNSNVVSFFFFFCVRQQKMNSLLAKVNTLLLHFPNLF